MKGYTVPTTFVAIDRYSAPLRKMAGATASFVNASRVGLAHTERAFRRLMTPITAINKMLMGMGYYVGLFTFILLMRGALGVIADFQQAQVDLAVVSGRTVNQNKALSNQARVMALRYGEAAKSVSALQLNLLKMGYSDQNQLLNMTEPIMAASIALKGAPDEVGKTIGAILQAFKIPDTKTSTVADLIAKAADLSALDWSDLQTMLPTAMKSANIAFSDEKPIDQLKRLLALFAMVRNAQVHVASGSTGIKNMLIDSGIKGKNYQEMLQSIIDSPNALKKAYKTFGRRTIVSALPLAEAQKMGDIENFISKMDDVGYVQRVASERLKSITGRVSLLKAAYNELILSFEDGTGPLAKSIEHYLQVGSAILLLAAGSDAAKGALGRMNPEVIKAAENALWWLRMLKRAAILLLSLRAIIFLWSIAVGVGTVAMGLWNIASGVMFAWLGMNAMALRGSTLALGAYRVAAWLAAAATKVFSAALWMNPITWLIGLIVALGVAIYYIVKKWDEWGAAVSMTLGPLGTLIAIIQSVRNNWDYLMNAFESGSILNVFKALRNILFDALLTPIQQVYALLAHVPGKVGETSAKMVSMIEAARLNYGLNANVNGEDNKIKDVSSRENKEHGNLTVNFKDLPENAEVSGNKRYIGNIQPSTQSTFRRNRTIIN